MSKENVAASAPVHRLVGRIHHDHACRILRGVLACWCAGIPMEQRREIRDRAISYLAAADTDDCVINRTNGNVCSRGTAGCHIQHSDTEPCDITERDRAVWRAAITLANNVCVQISDRANADDGPTEVISAASDCANRIRAFIEIDEDIAAELATCLPPNAQGQTAREAGSSAPTCWADQ